MKHVVVDLEMNPVDREFREVRKRLRDEVIEIGAVKLGEDYVQESTFRCYVKPEYGPIKKHITRSSRAFARSWTGSARKRRRFIRGACRTSSS